MDTYAECLNALHQISRAFEESGPSGARVLVDKALEDAERIAAQVESRLHDEYSKRQFLETVISSMADGVAVADAEQNITLVNEAAQELFGKTTAEEPLRVGSIGIYFPDGTPTPVDDMPLSKGLRGERFVDYEIVLVRPDGTKRYVRTSGAPIRTKDNRITGAVVVMHDLTIEHEFREQLEAQRRRLEQVVDRLPEGVLIAEGEDGILTVANRAARGILGDVPLGRSLWDPDIRNRIFNPDGSVLPLDDYPVYITIRQGRSERHRELLVIKQNRQRIYIILDTAPLYDQEGRIAGSVAVFRDVTVMKEERDKLQANYEREHYRTEVLQRSLLPLSTVQVEGYRIAATYRPAVEEERIGGDFYDSFLLPDGRAVFCIGDVSGKGVEAAIFTSLARDCIRTLILDTPKPAAVLKKLNKALYVYLPEDYFVTVFLAILEPETGKLVYASAGHDPPIIYRSKLNKAVELKLRGGLAGIFSDLTYNQRMIKLESGDALLLYTDGLADARRDGLVLGSGGLAALLAEKARKEPEQIIDEIYYHAVDFAGGSLHDDAAAILISSRTDEKA